MDASLRKTSVKYKAGYKITWKKMKNVSGYKVYVYYPAVKQWRCVKTTKNNKYTLTNLLTNEKVKLKVSAYKDFMTEWQRKMLSQCRMVTEPKREQIKLNGRMRYIRFDL